jgi:cell division protein FtsQ
MSSAARVDTRLRERRVAVQREAGRRRLRRLFVAGGCLGLVAAGVGLTRTPLLAVSSVVVVGAEHTRTSAIEDASGIHAGVAMVDVAPQAAAAELRSLPWVADATVRREWPRTIVVSIRERRPAVAVARPDGTWALADVSGRILALVHQPLPGLVHVHGIAQLLTPGQVVPDDALDAVRVAAALPPELTAVVGGVNLTPTGIELGLTQGHGVVRLGDASELDQKLRAAVTVLAKVPPRAVAVLDVRAPDTPVVARK